MIPYNRVYATIDLDAVKKNMESMRANLKEGTKMIGVIKTDGYGHGAVPIARVIDEFVCGYAVATIEEAIQLRKHGIEKNIIILGSVHETSYEDLIRYHVFPPIFQYEKAEKLSKKAVEMGEKAGIEIALDTGMSRIGMAPTSENAKMTAKINALPGIKIEGMFTHFAKADETDKEATVQQINQYLDFVEMLRQEGVDIPLKHCSNSAGIIDFKDANMDAVRAGISIYGLYPSDEVEKEKVPLYPVMGLKSFITYIKEIEPGTSISYGGTFTAEKKMKIATISIGYGDGYPRNLSGKGFVIIKGKKVPILGRVCMDQLMVDISEVPDAAEDDEVTLIGSEGNETISMEDLANAGGGFHYEIICDIGKRVPRVYIKNGQVVGTKDYFDDRYELF